MGDKFSVNPESLLQASARFALESEELGSALSRLQATLSSLGNVTGNDDQGRRFASGYDPAVNSLQTALQNLVKGLDGIGQGLDVMEANYQGSEQSSQVRKGG